MITLYGISIYWWLGIFLPLVLFILNTLIPLSKLFDKLIK